MKHFLWQISVCVFVLSCISGAQVLDPRANNTSGCSGVNLPYVGCSVLFTGLTDSINIGVQTTIPVAAPGNVSPLSLHSLFFTGWAGNIACEYQPWFFPGSGHITSPGMDESQQTTVTAQVNNMIARGCDVIVVDWYGQNASQATIRTVTSHVFTAVTGTPLKVAIMEDAGAVSPYCPIKQSGITQDAGAACLLTHLNSDMDYINTNYARTANYLTDPATGNPIVFFFMTLTAWNTPSFDQTHINTIWQGMAAHTDAYVPKPFTLTFEFGNFLSGPDKSFITDGEFAWPQPYAYNIAKQLCWDIYCPPANYSYTTDFYNTVKLNLTPLVVPFGMLEAGFDSSNASFGSNQVTAQRCGQTWLATVAAVNNNFNINSPIPLPFIMLATWNDYEEGTAVETGINNCYQITSSPISNSTLSWNLIPTDATYSTTTTIDHLEIFYKDSVWHDGGSLPVGQTSVFLPSIITTSGVYTVYVQMVGKAGILNQISAGQAYTSLIPSKGAINLYSVPLNSTANSVLWTHFNNLLNHPLYSGVSWTVPLGCAGCTGGTIYLDQTSTGPGGSYCPAWSFTGLDATLALVTGAGKRNNLILQGASFVNNTSTSEGVATQGWANNLSVDCTNMNPVLFHQTSYAYFPGDYICVGGVSPSCSGGNYYQMQNVVLNNPDTNDDHGTSAAIAPGCITTSPVSGCVDGQVIWTLVGANAPPQDFFCDTNVTGITQFDCYKMLISSAALGASITGCPSACLATVPLTATPTFTVGQVVNVSQPSITAYKCVTNSCTVSSIGALSVSYRLPNGGTNHAPEALSQGTTCITGSGCVTGNHILNINSNQATLAIVESQLPIPWELPMRIWRKSVQVAINSHYAGGTNGLDPLSYVRNGLTKAGETDTSNNSQWPIGPNPAAGNAQAQTLSYENEMFQYFKNNGAGTNFICAANLHSYGTLEAGYAAAQGCGFDNNALGVNQVTQIVLGNALVPGALPNSGDWPIAFKNYTVPVKILQTGGATQQSSPGACYPGQVGSMSASDTGCISAGTVTTSGTVVTYSSGQNFLAGWCGATAVTSPSIVIGGTTYTLSNTPTCTTTSVNTTVAVSPACSSPCAYSFPSPYNVSGYPGNLATASLWGMTVNEMYFCDWLSAVDPNYSALTTQCAQNEPLYPSSYQIPLAASIATFMGNGYSFGNSISGSFTIGH